MSRYCEYCNGNDGSVACPRETNGLHKFVTDQGKSLYSLVIM